MQPQPGILGTAVKTAGQIKGFYLLRHITDELVTATHEFSHSCA